MTVAQNGGHRHDESARESPLEILQEVFMRSIRGSKRLPPAAKQIITLIGLCVLLTALFWLHSPSLQAQDGEPAQPDGVTSQLYLPTILGGMAQETADIIPGEFIVVLQDAAARAAQGQTESAEAVTLRLSSSVNGEILFTYDAALSGFAVRVPEGEAEMAASTLASDPNVAYIEPNRVVQVEVTQTPATWGLDRIDQANLPLNNSYTYANNGAGVHAYIIDTGIRATHTQFTGRIGGGYTAISDGQGTNDCQGHGTHVAGTVGGSTYGVAKGVTLHPVRVLNCSGSGSNAGVIAGINWVTANKIIPAVANMSLGGSASSALDTALANSVAAGITYAVAAGNENQNACNVSPARAAAALTVGATTNTDARASFSNWGTCLDIFAPGASITSAVNTSDTATAAYSGTSMASPHVAGAAALYLAANPSAAPAQVAQALTTNATANKVTSPGTGSPNRLLYVGFIGAGGSPTATPTRTPVPPTATATPVGQPTATRTPTPTSTPATSCTNLLANPGFESGRVNWAESSSRGLALICSGTGCGSAVSPRTGNYAAWLGRADSEISQISQPVMLPAGQKTTLSFWRRTASNDYCYYDYGYVRVLSNGVTTTVKTYNLCASTNTSGWVKASIDLSAYAGRTVTLIFRTTTDSSLVSNFYLDDVQVVSGNACIASADGQDIIEPAAQDSGEDIPPSTEPKP
jgi:subtilisin family serine protease